MAAGPQRIFAESFKQCDERLYLKAANRYLSAILHMTALSLTTATINTHEITSSFSQSRSLCFVAVRRKPPGGTATQRAILQPFRD